MGHPTEMSRMCADLLLDAMAGAPPWEVPAFWLGLGGARILRGDET